MANLIEDTKGKTRDKPITARLRQILIDAADAAGVVQVRVTSGGQAKLGTPGKRTGSTRHDLGNAADLMLENAGQALDFRKPGELPIFERFVEEASARGATGIGAGVTYMGPHTLHVGFGAEAYWGAQGKQANAPSWLARAVLKGRARRNAVPGTPPPPVAPPAPGSDGRYIVNAPSGLSLRAGPGTEFPRLRVLPRGTLLQAHFDAAHRDWAKIDRQGEGLSDAYVFAAHIEPA